MRGIALGGEGADGILATHTAVHFKGQGNLRLTGLVAARRSIVACNPWRVVGRVSDQRPRRPLSGRLRAIPDQTPIP